MLLWRLIVSSSLLFVPAISFAELGKCTETDFRGCARAAIVEAPESEASLKELRGIGGTAVQELPQIEYKPEGPVEVDDIEKPRGKAKQHQKRALQIYLVLALFAGGAGSR